MERIIYIIGSGRSGTTLLDIILGNGEKAFSAGELNRFTKRDGIPHNARNENVANFWKKVNADLVSLGYNNPRYYYTNSKKYEYHTAVKHLIRFNPKRKSFKLYSQYQKDLFSSIEKNILSGKEKSIIIDSSKYPLRGFFLSHIFGDRISYVYIKRNPLAVVKSFLKKDIEQPSKSRLSANAYLLFTNGLIQIIEHLLKRKYKISTICYEDLLSSPIQTLEKLEHELGINLQRSKEAIIEDKPLEVGYLFDGNRLRLEDMVIFKRNKSNIKPVKIIDKFFYSLHTSIWYK